MASSSERIDRHPPVDPDFMTIHPLFLMDRELRANTTAALYYLMEKQKTLSPVFWFSPEGAPTLFEFAEFCYDPKRFMFLLSANNVDIAGMVWIDNLKGEHSAQLGLWFNRRYWGFDTLAMVEKTVEYLWSNINVSYLFCYSPWHTVSGLADRLGLPCVARIPRMVPNRPEQDVSVYIFERGG